MGGREKDIFVSCVISRTMLSILVFEFHAGLWIRKKICVAGLFTWRAGQLQEADANPQVSPTMHAFARIRVCIPSAA